MRPRVEPGDPASAALRSALSEGLQWIRVNEPAARRGEVAGVHHLRTTTRRLRTTLHLYADLTEPAWADALADELKWLAGLLGEVRDLDVLAERLGNKANSIEGVPADALEPLFQALRTRHAIASDGLERALREARFESLEARLARAADEIPLTDKAERPCRKVLPGLVGKVWKRLARDGRALGADDPDDDFHEVRKRAKQARYAAEAVASAFDSDLADSVRRFARRARVVQDILGAHQDAVVAFSEVLALASSHSDLGPFNLAAGQLLAMEHQTSIETRERFFDAWSKLDRNRITRWMK